MYLKLLKSPGWIKLHEKNKLDNLCASGNIKLLSKHLKIINVNDDISSIEGINLMDLFLRKSLMFLDFSKDKNITKPDIIKKKWTPFFPNLKKDPSCTSS